MRTGRDKTRQQQLDQPEGQSGQENQTREKIRIRVRQMLSDSPTEQNKEQVVKGKIFLHLKSNNFLIYYIIFQATLHHLFVKIYLNDCCFLL